MFITKVSVDGRMLIVYRYLKVQDEDYKELFL